MNKVGMHIHHLRPEVHQAVIRIQPRAVVVVNPSPQWIKDIHSAAPGCYIGVRKFEDGVPFWERVPEEWADETAAMCGDALSLVSGAITYNEPMPRGHDEPLHFPLFDEWQRRVIIRLQETHGVDALAFAFGTGQFTAAEDRVRLDMAFPGSCEVCRIVTPHDYDWPNIWKSEGWRAMRWLAWLDDIEQAGYGRKKVLVGEWGLTQGTYGGPDIGWRSGVSLDDYARQMDEYNARLCDIPEAIAFCPFDWGGRDEYGWDTFEHVYPDDFAVVDKICSIRCPEIPEPEPEPNGGDEMVKIYDFENGPPDGQTRDWAWLESVFGSKLRIYPMTDHYPNIQDGDWYYAVDYLDARTGETSCIINTRDENGQPVAEQKTVFFWSTAETLEEQGFIVDPWCWTNRGAVGPTNDNGDAGPGLGKGAYYDPKTEEGPHKVWIYNLPSEMVAGIGMLATGEPEPGVFGPHAHVNVGFVRKQWQGEGPPVPPTPPDDPGVELVRIGERLINIGYGLRTATPTKITLGFADGREKEYALATPTTNILSKLRSLVAGR